MRYRSIAWKRVVRWIALRPAQFLVHRTVTVQVFVRKLCIAPEDGGAQAKDGRQIDRVVKLCRWRTATIIRQKELTQPRDLRPAELPAPAQRIHKSKPEKQEVKLFSYGEVVLVALSPQGSQEGIGESQTLRQIIDGRTMFTDATVA
jgi:hypothetical protein